MSVIHICNTFFENELESPPSSRSLISWLRSHPVILQLQFLPLLYAEKEDSILVSDPPDPCEERISLLETYRGKGKIADWGPSQAIARWAKKQCIPYLIPDWEIVRTVNSKIYSFMNSPKLPGADLLGNEKEVLDWVEKTEGSKVLKTAYGTAGRGHFHFGKNRDLNAFLQGQFSQKLPVIGEPWVQRVLDFSTQWVVSKEKNEFLGATIIENRSNGSYLATFAGKSFSSFAWALEQHLSIVKPLLSAISKLGFFGNLGVDAFVYLENGVEKIHPVVEINARKTMSWAALAVQRKICPDQVLRFSFEKNDCGPLPQRLYVEEKEIFFSHQIGQKLTLV